VVYRIVVDIRSGVFNGGIDRCRAGFDQILHAGRRRREAYPDALEESHPDWSVSGGGAWIYLDAGFSFRIAERMYLGPRVGMLATFIEFQNSYGLPSSMNSKKATVIFLPGIGCKYDLTPKPSTFFAAADLSLVAPSSDISPSLESGGVAIGGTLGYSFSHEVELALAYRYVPVKASGDETSNFGGISFLVRKTWGF
jgi:hypothetical protein